MATEQKRTQVLCGWIAFALQTAGDALVEADYAADKNTIGYVPGITLRQAVSFYEEVDDWACNAKEAAANPHFRLDVAAIPTAWPAWVEVEPCPTEHLAAMIQMAERFGQRVLLLFDPGRKVESVQEPTVNYIKQLLARGDQRRDRALALWRQGGASQQRHENIEDEVKTAIAAYFVAGQVMAMPELVDAASRREQLADGRKLAVPGQSGFDPWCLTDPQTRPRWQRDRAAKQAIDVLWRYDPNPKATLSIQAEIDAALASGHIAPLDIGNYFCCPWAAIYQVVNPLTIGGKRLRRGNTFTFDVSAEEMMEGGRFKREILVANFVTTNEIDYCNPEAGGHDD